MNLQCDWHAVAALQVRTSKGFICGLGECHDLGWMLL